MCGAGQKYVQSLSWGGGSRSKPARQKASDRQGRSEGKMVGKSSRWEEIRRARRTAVLVRSDGGSHGQSSGRPVARRGAAEFGVRC